MDSMHREAGPLGEAMEDFLFSASYENHCASVEKRDAMPMKGRERKLKHDFIRGIRRDLKSVEYLWEPLQGRNYANIRFWFDQNDIALALDKQSVLNLIQISLSLLPPDMDREYADAILAELGNFYRNKGEEIVLQRQIDNAWFSASR
jgi:hypothetical protein